MNSDWMMRMAVWFLARGAGTGHCQAGKLAIATLTRVAAISLLCGCARERGLEPQPVKYNLYVENRAGDAIYVIDTDSTTIVDSIALEDPGWISSLAASSDGKWLYAHVLTTGGQGSYSAKIDLKARTIAGKLLGPTNLTALVALHDGLMVLRETCTLEFIDVSTWTVVANDTTRVCYARPVAGSNLISGWKGDADSVVIYDPDVRTIRKALAVHTLSGDPVLIAEPVLTPDQSKVLLTGRSRSTGLGYFLVVNVANDSTLLQYPLEIGRTGWVFVTPDGTRAIVTEHGATMFDDHRGAIHIIDLTSLKHVASLKTFQSSVLGPVGQVAMVPGTSRAIVAMDLGGLGPFFEVDWKVPAIVGHHLSRYYLSGPLAVGEER